MNNEIAGRLIGGASRFVEGLASAAPTLIVGLFVAAVLRYYLGKEGTQKLFGGDGWLALPKSWAVGMLLPVCSIGVLPILFEMRRAGVRRGALSAFALSAPLFNPLSLLYGLTLSRPLVVILFAMGSLLIVTVVGMIWDRFSKGAASAVVGAEQGSAGNESDEFPKVIGIHRLLGLGKHMLGQLVGPVGAWTCVALSGVALLGLVLPHGELQSSVERDDWTAPLTMTAVAWPVYATPMLAMSQLGMMFQHANSPGAAFALLVLGTGVNFATIGWFARAYGVKSSATWAVSVLVIVVGIAYTINRPLIPPGVEPAGHTHAFDIYTSPVPAGTSANVALVESLWKNNIDIVDRLALFGLLSMFALGVLYRVFARGSKKAILGDHHGASQTSLIEESQLGWDRVVSPRIVGATILVGLVAISVVMCYGYYPSAEDSLEEIRIARAETLSAANAGQVEHALYWLKVWEDWSRKLEVGVFLREGEVRPYQRMQGYLIRKRLELLEHELEHDPVEIEEIRAVIRDLFATNDRWVKAFKDAAP